MQPHEQPQLAVELPAPGLVELVVELVVALLDFAVPVVAIVELVVATLALVASSPVQPVPLP